MDNVAPLRKFKQKSEVDLPYFDRKLVTLARIRDRAYRKVIIENDVIKKRNFLGLSLVYFSPFGKCSKWREINFNLNF